MKLHGSLFSPYVRHCRVALAETGLDHDFVETDYDQSAKLSPTARVPFLEDGELRLNDSASILRHIRERAGQPFMPDIEDYELFLLANTGLDSTVNLFLLERDGLTPERVPYLARQAARVRTVLSELDRVCGRRVADFKPPFTDGLIRTACYLNWATFRERLDHSGFGHLVQLVDALGQWPAFAEFDPRRFA
ncbi:MAG: glutathione S-transferase family protein [Wenzhouxiangella sp.]|jgi:glutathione S-transferase|nr:glutathione S-transferase family protein [Wenzhouxiangella sp.]